MENIQEYIVQFAIIAIVLGGWFGFSFQFFSKIGEMIGDYCVKRYILWKQKKIGRNK